MSTPTDFWSILSNLRSLEGGDIATAIASASKVNSTEANPLLRTSRELMLREIERAYGFTSAPDTGFSPVSGASTPPGTVSVVTACMNRNENLVKALRTWLPLAEIGEVLIVDWSSETTVQGSLEQAGIADERITILRVENEPRWILSWAYNLGFTYVSNTQVLKLDADILLDRKFFDSHRLSAHQFFAGDWRLAKDGQQHINGIFYCHTDDLMKAGGFNEYIQSYGWDDDDLYLRMCDYGLHKQPINPNLVHHLEHSDADRIGSCQDNRESCFLEAFEKSPDVKIKFNEKLASILPPWNGHKKRREYVALGQEEGGPKRLTAKDSSSIEIPPYFVETAKLLTAYQLLSWQIGPAVLHIEPKIIEDTIARKPLDAITLDSISERKKATSKQPIARKKLFIDAQHGLGNRLRAIASAAAIAEATGRRLVIVWQPDDHCEGLFSDLFSSPFEVINKSPQRSELENTEFYNYMEAEEGSDKEALIDMSKHKNVYVRSAYVLNHSASDWAAENRALRKFQVSKEILELVNSVDIEGRLAAHVRMVGGASYEHLSYEAQTNWTLGDQEEIGKWRAASHYSNFFTRIDSMLMQSEIARVFVAADLPETYDAFLERYPGRICYLKRGLFDRSAEQLKYALADALLLSKHKHILGSSWSSFTELATRLSVKTPALELSGKDF